MQIYNTTPARFELPRAQEEEDSLGRLDIIMNQDDQQEVMMVLLEQEQLFFLAHPEGGRGMTDVQMISLTVEKMRACGPLYGRALSVWHSKDSEFCRHWKNFCTTINDQYVEMLARRSNSTLADNVHGAYNTIADK